MRKSLLLLAATTLIISGCSSSERASQSAHRPILVDEYSLLDDKGQTRPNDQILKRRLEEARRHYLYAMRASEQGKSTIASRHFEQAMSILNDLITYPDIYANEEFTRLSESIIRDYEDQITSIDSLDANSSFFVLRDRIFQEIETIPVERKKYPTKRQLATINSSSNNYELQIELTDNTPVQQCITYFTSEKGRRFFSRWLGLTGRYFPLYERILAEEGVPQELRHLSMIESGLSPKAVSWAKAVGLWQFIPSTGGMYGLTINWWVDERRDPEKATRAAARYLKDLHEELGDWHLALAAYNCGPGRVRSAIAKAGSRDYWEVRKFLPRETQQYVPLFIAASRITLDPEAYGFTNIEFVEPLEYDVMPLKGSFDLAMIASAAGTTVDEIKGLNPELLQDRIPTGERFGYSLRIPVGSRALITAAIENTPVPVQPQIDWVNHRVKRGETLTGIAERYGVTVANVSAANGLTPKSNIRRGATLRIPVEVRASSPATDTAALADNSGDSNNDNNSASEPSTAPTARTQPKPTVASQPRRSEPVARTVPKTTHSQPAARSTATHNAPAAVTPTPEQREFVAAMAQAPHGAIAGGRSDEPARATPNASAHESMRRASTTPRSTTRTAARSTSHKVTSGETLTGIARRYNVSVSDLADWNNIERTANVRIGQRLKIHGGKTPSSSGSSDRVASRTHRRPTTTTSRYETHRVRRGESLTSIADHYGVAVDDLKTWNRRSLSGGKLLAGTSLRIYSEQSAKGDSHRSSRTQRSSRKSYTVRRGDSLSAIARRFGVSLRDLKQHNPKITDRSLQAGQTLRIN